MVGFCTLSDDILIEILSYFHQEPEEKPTLCRIARVSRRLYCLTTHCLLRDVAVYDSGHKTAHKKFRLFLRAVLANDELGQKVQSLCTGWKYLDAGGGSQELLARLVNIRHLHIVDISSPRFRCKFNVAPRSITYAISPTVNTLRSLRIEGRAGRDSFHDGTRLSLRSFKVLKAALIASDLLFSRRCSSFDLYTLLPHSLSSLTVFCDESGYMPSSLAWLSELCEYKFTHTPSLTHVALKQSNGVEVCINGLELLDDADRAAITANYVNWEPPRSLKAAFKQANIHLETRGTQSWGRTLFPWRSG